MREVEEEKQAMAAYGSSDSGASLGDILGAALKERADSGTEEEPKKKARAKKAAASDDESSEDDEA